MTHLFAPVIFGLAASLCLGNGDFSGGLASRRANVGSVVITDYAVGLILLVTLALIGKEPVPAPADLAGRGKMLAPHTLPAVFSRLDGNAARPLQRVHRRAADAAAVGWLCTRRAFDWTDLMAATHDGTTRRNRIGGAGGCGFGCFFILISRVYPATTFWSLAAARCTSIAVLLPVIRLRRTPLLPRMTGIPLVVLAGILDALGNVLFVLAAHRVVSISPPLFLLSTLWPRSDFRFWCCASA